MRRSAEHREEGRESSADRKDDRVEPRRRRRLLLALAAVTAVAVLVGGGWALARSFESPAQKAAKAEAPPPGSVTATVASGDLTRMITASATVVRAIRESVDVGASLASGVVTGTPIDAAGSLASGRPVLEVNGRPLIAMPGAFPFYRDLTMGDAGPDVKQLQAALAAAGFSVSPDGVFGAATAKAVEALYARAGYSVPTVEAADDAATDDEAADDAAAGRDASVQPGAASSAEGDAGAEAPGGVMPSAADRASRSVSIPMTELIVFASLPANVVTAPPVGTVLTSTSRVSVEGGALIATAPIAPTAAATIRKGMTGVLTGPDGRRKAITVASLGAGDTLSPSGAGTGGSDTSDDSADERESGITIDGKPVTGASSADDEGATVRMKATRGMLPDAWLHGSGVAEITIEIAAGDSLIVPTVAVVSGGRSAAHVLRRERDGSFTAVPVREVGVLEGKSAVRPTESDALKPGDRVKVG